MEKRTNDWEPSVLAVIGVGLVVALIIMLFVQQSAVAELRTRVDFLEATMETELAGIEEKTDQVIYLIGLADYEEARASGQD